MNKKGRSDPSQSSFVGKKDPFNLSNDEYYNPKHVSSSQGLSGFDDSNVVQHSTPALNLHSPWFPTHLSMSAMRHFHRPKLKIHFGPGEESTGFYSITSLTKHIAQKEQVGVTSLPDLRTWPWNEASICVYEFVRLLCEYHDTSHDITSWSGATCKLEPNHTAN